MNILPRNKFPVTALDEGVYVGKDLVKMLSYRRETALQGVL